jgi:hypothetical protein
MAPPFFKYTPFNSRKNPEGLGEGFVFQKFSGGLGKVVVVEPEICPNGFVEQEVGLSQGAAQVFVSLIELGRLYQQSRIECVVDG